jgi:hypothetical protein
MTMPAQTAVRVHPATSARHTRIVKRPARTINRSSIPKLRSNPSTVFPPVDVTSLRENFWLWQVSIVVARPRNLETRERVRNLASRAQHHEYLLEHGSRLGLVTIPWFFLNRFHIRHFIVNFIKSHFLILPKHTPRYLVRLHHITSSQSRCPYPTFLSNPYSLTIFSATFCPTKYAVVCV